jgi:hypothetical protein
VAAAQEQRRVAPRLAAEGVAGGVADRVRLGLDDAPGSSRTTTLPSSQRASVTVSLGSSARRRRRRRPGGALMVEQVLEADRMRRMAAAPR